MAKAHEIDYQIYGDDMQFVEISLDPGETVIAEAGAMMYMDGAVRFDTVFGTGSEKDQGKGLMDKVIGAGKRVLTGESLFMTTFTNQGSGKKVVAFAAPYPGKVIPVNLAACGGQLICQRDAFLCAAKGIEIEIAFTKKRSVRASSAVKALLCSGWSATAWPSSMPAAPLQRRNSRPGKCLSWIPAAWWP